MDKLEVTTQVKGAIAKVTGLEPADIGDNASFVDDLDLDSLSMMEIGIEVDFLFKLDLSEDEMGELRTVSDAVNLALRKMAAKDDTGDA